MKYKSKILYTLIIICILQYFIINPLEKLYCYYFLNNNNDDIIKRPFCFDKTLYCIGMPSGHAEIITILSTVLYYHKYISFIVYITLLSVICLQRVFYNKHTILQVVIGIIFGLLFSFTYIKLESFYFAFIFIYVFVLLFIIFYKVDSLIREPIPEWVDKNMIVTITKKQNTNIFVKLNDIVSVLFDQEISYISWRDLEEYLEKIIEKINKSGIKYDAIIGIKSGGAIISDYISKRLNITNYKVKLSRKEYNCNKTTSLYHVYIDIVKRSLFKNNDTHDICEGISEDLSQKNVILIDELVDTGITMYQSINYLKNEKKVNNIYPVCISSKGRNIQNVDYVIPNRICIFPWGYDN